MTNKLEENILKEFTKRFENSSLFDSWDGCEKDLKRFLSSSIKKVYDSAIEDMLKALDEIAIWPEPQPGAGQEIGALFGAGMYQQYDSDREKHEQQIKEIKEKLLKLK